MMFGPHRLSLHTCSNDRKELIWQKGERVVNAHTQDNITIDEHFVGRTQLFINEDKRNCSLLLRHISTADAGVYTCYAIEKIDDSIYLTESTEVNLTGEFFNSEFIYPS